jgi:hypothetical protein
VNALNLNIEYPKEAPPGWANRWAYDYTTNQIIPVRMANGLVWISSPNDAGALPQVPTGLVILEDPYKPIELFLWVSSAAVLLAAFIVNLADKLGVGHGY